MMEEEKEMQKAQKKINKLKSELRESDKEIITQLKKVIDLQENINDLIQASIESQNSKTNKFVIHNFMLIGFIGAYFVITFLNYSQQTMWLYIINSILFSIVTIIAIRTNTQISSED